MELSGFSYLSNPSFNGKPSTTNSGLVAALIEPIPRILICEPPPGAALVLVILTPAMFPEIAWAKLDTGLSFRFSEETEDIAVETSLFFIVP